MNGRKPGEIAWGDSSGGKERYGNDDWVDGRETVGNSLGELGGKERYGNDDRMNGRKPGEIAWGELRWEGAIRE